MIILLTVAHQLNLGRAAQLRQRTRGHDLLIRDEPRNSRALQSSCPNREVLRTLLPSHRTRLILVGRNRRVPSQVNAKNWKVDTPLPLPNRAVSADKWVPEEIPLVASKGVILVSEAFTEINAGLVIVLASGHQGPLHRACWS